MRTVIVGLAVLTSVALVSCGDSLSLNDRPCPCADGWTCCTDENVCVPDGEACPGQDTVSQTDSSTETSGTSTGDTQEEWTTETQTCEDIESHSDCPSGQYCCDFVPIADHQVCLPQTWWDQVNQATCSNKETQIDSDTGVVEGGQCSATFGPAGKLTGTCQKLSDHCAGGFANPDYIPPFYVGKDPQFDCAEGLLCCIDTDQCEVIDAGLKSIVPTQLEEGSGASCQNNGGCEDPAYEISDNFACPDGQTCCFTTLF